MSTKTIIGVALAAAASLIQVTPAPPIAAAPFISVAVQGTTAAVTTAIHETSGGRRMKDKMVRRVRARQLEAPEGVPQFEFDRCVENLDGVTIHIAGPFEGNAIEITGIPPTCMNLANVLISDWDEGPFPVVCGTDCLRYEDLSEDQYYEYKDIFENL